MSKKEARTSQEGPGRRSHENQARNAYADGTCSCLASEATEAFPIQTIRTKWPPNGLWPIYHTWLMIGYGMQPQFYGSFGPQCSKAASTAMTM